MKSRFLLLLILGFACAAAHAETSYSFTCNDAKINASIKYSVIGRYQASFSDCAGTVFYDEVGNQIQAVELRIKTKSIGSNCAWCDKIVLSKQLLNAETYPLIIFKSESFLKKDKNYEVSGILNLHGVSGKLKFPFFMEDFNNPKDGKQCIRLKGQWIINRKEFAVTWNKLLDRGGFLVGNQVTVAWEVLLKK